MKLDHGQGDSWKCTYVIDGNFSVKELAIAIVKGMAYEYEIPTIWSTNTMKGECISLEGA